MKKKPIAMKKGGAPKTSLRPKRRPPSLRPKARPSGKLPSTSEGTPIEIGPMPERGDIELMLMEEKERVNKKMGGGKMHRMPDGSMMAGASHGMNYGGKVKKMKHGGKCRGMGAATRGGNFSKDG
jgi:hypothetical protein